MYLCTYMFYIVLIFFKYLYVVTSYINCTVAPSRTPHPTLKPTHTTLTVPISHLNNRKSVLQYDHNKYIVLIYFM